MVHAALDPPPNPVDKPLLTRDPDPRVWERYALQALDLLPTDEAPNLALAPLAVLPRPTGRLLGVLLPSLILPDRDLAALKISEATRDPVVKDMPVERREWLGEGRGGDGNRDGRRATKGLSATLQACCVRQTTYIRPMSKGIHPAGKSTVQSGMYGPAKASPTNSSRDRATNVSCKGWEGARRELNVGATASCRSELRTPTELNPDLNIKGRASGD